MRYLPGSNRQARVIALLLSRTIRRDGYHQLMVAGHEGFLIIWCRSLGIVSEPASFYKTGISCRLCHIECMKLE